MLHNISLQLEDPRQLLMLLKLALAAGGTGFESLFDSLRGLVRSPPSRMSDLPLLLCSDAIQHIHKAAIDRVHTASSPHPMMWEGFGKLRSLVVRGASSIRLEVDGRTNLPPGVQLVARTSERTPYTWKVPSSPPSPLPLLSSRLTT